MLFSNAYPQAFGLTFILLLSLLVGCAEDKKAVVTKPSVTTQERIMQPDVKSVVTSEKPVQVEKVEVENKEALEKSAEITKTKNTEIKSDDRKVAVEKKPSRKKQEARAKLLANLEFDLIRHSFDTIQSGDIIDYKFEFTNTGKGPLVIESAKATCGCTQPSYPFIPIEPGEKGYIGVTYNSVGKEGLQKPLITVRSNASKEPVALMLTGFVEPKKKAEKKVEEKQPAEALDSLIKG